MSLVPTSHSPDELGLRPSFRKPSNDGAHRKYRHHSAVDGSDSSSAGDSPKHDKSIIHENYLENRNKGFDRDRKYHGKESEREPGRSHSSRGSDSHRYPDNARSSRDYQQGDERGGYHRITDDEDRNSVRYSGRETRPIHTDRAKHDNSFEKSKESHNTDRNVDRFHSTEKSEASGYRSRGKDREENAPENRYNEKEYPRASSGSRQIASSRENKSVDEWNRPRERDGRDDKKIRHRSPNDYKKEIVPTPEDGRRHAKDSFIGRDYRIKGSQRKEIDEQDYLVHKRRYNDRDNRKYGDKYPQDPNENRKESDLYQRREEKSEIYVDKNSNTSKELSSSKKSKIAHSDQIPRSTSEGNPSSSKQVKESTEKFTPVLAVSPNKLTESAQDVNAAKVAAMQAAELVNRNLVGTGFMSTDQKKKLLWGSKKNTSEESGTRWDLQLFEDRERQEKFNKLMGVKGDAMPPERKPDEKDVEKQKELQIDLEKQYTAGLRRRDGRTVGLGL